MKFSLPGRPSEQALRRGLLWLAFFLIYALTTARDLLPADSGEFQLVAATWGIAHPPGYPLYTIAGALWVRLFPLGSVPFRLNLLSAVLAATTLLLLFEAVCCWAQAWGLEARAARFGGFVAAAALGTSATFWAQATMANIRVPAMLFTTWGFLALAHYRAAEDAGRQRWALLELALALGLGVGHHPSLIFVAAGWAIYLLLLDPRLPLQPRRWWLAVPIAALAWLIPQLYLPFRGGMPGVPLAPEGIASWEGFWHHVLARGFGGDMFAFATATDLVLRLPLLPSLFRMQFAPPVLVLAIVGWLWLAARHHRLALALLASWAIHTFVSITYRAPQTIEYLMPAYVPVVVVLGSSSAVLLQALRQRPGAIAARAIPLVYGAAAILLGGRLAARLPDFATLAADNSIRERTAPLLAQAPADAVVLADWRWATPLWVLQATEGLRPDVEVREVYPVAGVEYEEVWRMRVAEVAGRPVLTTHAYTWEEWTFAPLGGGFRLFPRPLDHLPEALGFTLLEAEMGPVRLLGYRIAGTPDPGRRVEVQLAWQATGEQAPPPSFTARLWDAGGGLLAQADRFLGSDAAPSEVRFTRLTLQLPIDRCTGAVHPTVGAYAVENGEFRDLGEVSLPALAATCDYPRLPTAHPHLGVVPGGPWLRGLDYDVTGDRTRLYLHWCGPGEALHVAAGEATTTVAPLGVGACQTVALPVPSGGRPALTLQRLDGTPARLLAPPLPAPRPGDRYLPFGDTLVLTGSETSQRGGMSVLALTWRAARPLATDYAVSVRFLDAEGNWLAMHDIQPGLGAFPTLKWVVRGVPILDPHPVPPGVATPACFSVAVYERFRLTPLPASYEEGRCYPWDPF